MRRVCLVLWSSGKQCLPATSSVWLPQARAAGPGVGCATCRERDRVQPPGPWQPPADRKSTRLNSSHQIISYAVFCLKKKKKKKKIKTHTYIAKEDFRNARGRGRYVREQEYQQFHE